MVTALERLIKAVAPPDKPSATEGDIPQGIPALPRDYLSLIGAYGSGSFYVEQVGDLVILLNPYSHDYLKRSQDELDMAREVKRTEGDDYIPYEIYPKSPGLLIWGYGEDRKHYFWLTEGKPDEWPVIVMYDIEIFTRFDVPMTEFLRQLFCGEIECNFIGFQKPYDRIDPSDVTFEPIQ